MDWHEKYEREKEYQREYRRKNREKRNAYNKSYKEEKHDQVREQDHVYRNSEIGRARNLACKYAQSDANYGFDTTFSVSAEWILENIFKSTCIYCGNSDWTHLGCDRIDNTKGHTPDNVVCCCGKCNVEKGRWYSVEEFKEMKNLDTTGIIPTFVSEDTNGLH